ncbi:2-oxoacid:acceptor oxidoreductase family protein [Sansalvadorimonas sp. 2012CJ34-2]|uniref:2-oxoacid:acceptor oxidoreductase family protein n=1 Tax=Parendozoicomonas callyspongiae TaxID=2942213 RepID=A0ABT0PFI6_9GAMM|nr:2-oxoacid:acceptor oxidoreductase family protein [Sansalvadorimonas sp. 2012CJ34-2]
MKKEPDHQVANNVKYPGKRMAMDGNTAVIMCEREASDAAGAYPITPSTQMGEYWAIESAKGHVNVGGKPLIFVEPESEHAAAAVTAGMAMSGLRATNFSSAQGIAYMHESLYAAVGKRLPYVLNVGARAMTKSTLNVHCSHDDYHCVDDTGFFQLFGATAQEAADLNLIGRKIAEESLTPAIVAQDGFLTTHLIEPVMVPERELVEEFCGRPDDIIDCPTPAQKMIYGPKRRRVPELWDVDNPIVAGPVQNQDAYMQSVAAQRPYFFEHIREITDRCMKEYGELTGRHYQRAAFYKMEDAEYVIVGQGSMPLQANAVADYMREKRGIKMGVVNLTMFRPFPGDLLGAALKGRKGVCVLERTDQPLAEDLPIIREMRAVLTKCLENGMAPEGKKPYPLYDSFAATDAPRMYSGCYGLGSRDFQPEGVIAAIENMLDDGAQKPFFYLGIDFVREQAANPKDEIRRQEILDAYPHVKELSLKGSENPNLLPEGAITVRMHSIGGWGMITTGKNLSMTLYDLLGYDIRANPKYGSEKKGMPTTYYLSAAPEPIRINCEHTYVDVVMSPDAKVFSHSNPLMGLKEGGTFIIQSEETDPNKVWAKIPRKFQQEIVDRGIRVFFIDGFKIAREEASNVELQFRMQGNVFQGSFFAASPLMEKAGLDEEGLFKAIEGQLRAKFGHKGERIVTDNIRVVRRGFDEVVEITEKVVGVYEEAVRKEEKLPVMLSRSPESSNPQSSLHDFWDKVGSFYVKGQGNDNPADPNMSMSLMPAGTGMYRDMTQIRFEYPKYIPEKCTACGDCYTVCPDSALPGLANTLEEVFKTAVDRIETKGMPTLYLRRETRALEKRVRALVDQQGEAANVTRLIDQAVLERLADESDEKKKSGLEKEFAQFLDIVGDFGFAITKPYYTNMEKKQKGSGGLFSITLNPMTCKGCMECVRVCSEGALVAEPQTEEDVARIRKNWEFWNDLPTTGAQFNRIDDLDEKIGALETMLMNKDSYMATVSGDGACLGCAEKTVIHLFTSTVSSLMQPRVKKHLAQIDQLVAQLETHVRMKLAGDVDFSDTSAVAKAIEEHKGHDLTLSGLTESMGQSSDKVIDAKWLRWVTQLMEKLKHLKWLYTDGNHGTGRAFMGATNATGCTSVWGATYPYNPYPFPWANHLFQDSPSLAMGIFEGHMCKMADGFKLLRQAEIELKEGYDFAKHDEFMTHFNWRDFSDEEFHLCPPIVAIGGDGAMYDIGFQNMSRLLASGHPLKVMVLDTQVYSNTGGQACTSSFVGQVADMAPYGKAKPGKIEEKRKEISLIGLAHRTSYILQSSISHTTHLLEGFIDGLNARRPALFNIYCVCPAEHGVADDVAKTQAKVAVDSRAYPLFSYNPEHGDSIIDCSSLEGNAGLDKKWLEQTIRYVDEQGAEQKMVLPLTFADFAMTEARFSKHFKKVPVEAWNDDMIPLHEFLELSVEDRDGLFPYVMGTDKNNHLVRVLVAQPMVDSCEERVHFWNQLRSITGQDVKNAIKEAEDKARAEFAGAATSAIQQLAGGNVSAVASASSMIPVAADAPAAAAAPSGDAVWIETGECTACDDCININSSIFGKADDGTAFVANAQGGPFKDIVKAAEKCPAGCLHPGAPMDMGEKDVEKLIKRAEKFQ